MSVPIALLGLLEREPSHGYELKRDYDAYFGRGKALPFGQVYATLGRLARDGKVLPGEVEPGAGPDRKRYAITPVGTSEVETWLATPIEPEPHLQTVLFEKVVLALMLGRSAEHYLDIQRGAHLQRMRQLTELKRSGTSIDALLADHGLFHLRSRSSLDRSDGGPSGLSGRGGPVVSTAHLAEKADGGVPVLEARDVQLSFGATPALRGASLTVAAGEILAVMGPSGSGKSTLLHCLAGILKPDRGEILFAGRRVDTMGEQARSSLRRDHFGFVFQFGQLVPELTAEENVALPLLLGGAPRAQALDEARAWFEPLGLDGLERRRSGELSGGQAQRVALARGLVSRPEVLFADEPTGSLDSLTGEQVMELLVSATRQQGTTVVLVTHEARVAAYAGREVMVRDGKASSLSAGRVQS